MKTCRTCGQEFKATLDNFYRNKYSKDGLDYLCKGCKNAERTKYNEMQRDNIKIIDGVTYKYCSKCEEWKVREGEFEKLKRWFKKDCISCRSKAKRDLQKKRKLTDKTAKKTKIERDKLEEAAYKRLIAQAQDVGIGDKKLDIDLVIGKKYTIANPGVSDYSTKYKKVSKGILTQVTDNLIVFRTSGGYCVSFMIKDVLLGECELREAI